MATPDRPIAYRPVPVIVLAAALLQGCATGGSQLLGERYFTTDIHTYPVQISSVDGSSSTVEPKVVMPGPRRIVVQGPPGGAGNTRVEVLRLDIKPCTRYYIVAYKPNALDTAFTPRVDFEQPLGGCRAPAS